MIQELTGSSEMVGKKSRNGCLKKSALPELSRACEKDSSPLKAEI